jgi:trigger factor
LEILLDKKSEESAIIKVVVKEDDYASTVDKKIKEYGKTANLKGFRPGKAPISLVKKMVGTRIKVDEVLRTAYSSVDQYIKENQLEIIGEPLPLPLQGVDFDFGKDFEISFELGIVPAFEMNLAQDIQLTRYSVDITDIDIDNVIGDFRKRMATFPDIDAATETAFLAGEMTNGDLFNEDALMKISEIKESARPLFVGKKVGDVVEFNFEDVFAQNNKTLLFKTDSEVKGHTKFVIKRINEVVPHEINQEFFDKLFGQGTVTSEQEMRNRVREIVVRDYEKATKERLMYDLRDAAVRKYTFPIDKAFLKRFLENKNENFDAENFEKEYEKVENVIRWQLLQARFARMNEVKLKDEHIIQQGADEVSELLQQNGMSFADIPEDDREKIVKNYMEREKGKHMQDFANRAHDKLMTEKMLEAVKITDKTISTEEFNNLAW